MPVCSYVCCEGDVYRHYRGRAVCEDHYKMVLAEWLDGLSDELQDVPWQEVPDVSTATAARFSSILQDGVDELAPEASADRREA